MYNPQTIDPASLTATVGARAYSGDMSPEMRKRLAELLMLFGQNQQAPQGGGWAGGLASGINSGIGTVASLYGLAGGGGF